MFFLVKLKCSKKLLIPQKWIKGISDDLTKLLNYGVYYHKNKTYKVFVSPDFETKPDFGLPVSDVYTSNSACYEATIDRCFDSFEDGWAKMNTQRVAHTSNDVTVLDDSDIDELQAMITDDEDEDALDLHD